jgi:hypothetical protein
VEDDALLADEAEESPPGLEDDESADDESADEDGADESLAGFDVAAEPEEPPLRLSVR